MQGTAEEHWLGTLALPRSDTTIPVEVRLPPSFPDALPTVSVPKGTLSKRIAHVVGGTVCVVPTSNVFVDADRPEALVEEALRRASEVLDQGTIGESDADLDAEFQAYWVPTDDKTVLSYCDVDGPARQIVICQVTSGSKLINDSEMIADRIEDIERWAEHMGAKLGAFSNGLFIPVSASIPLPSPGQPTTVSQIAHLVKRHGGSNAEQLLGNAIVRADYPHLIALSMPEAPANAGRRLAAVRIERPKQASLKEAQRGFRRGHVPAGRILNQIGRMPVARLDLQRVDRAYLATRGGAATCLAEATAIVVGVGAVGSEVARNLAAVGVGHIRLVDSDAMAPENVHRHVLGMGSTGYGKATALTVELWRSFPHLDIDARAVRVETLLEKEPAFLIEGDLIILATGEETLERRMNRLLQGGPPRLHTWLEPLSIGGHSFACGSGNGAPGSRRAIGCFECLYRPDDAFGLVNRTALTAPGQEIRQSIAGCAGTFSPFSPLDARRTALDATELATRILTGEVSSAVLVSWRGVHTAFEAAGYKLSRRAAKISPGTRVEVEAAELVRDDCPVCGAGAQTTTSPGGGVS